MKKTITFSVFVLLILFAFSVKNVRAVLLQNVNLRETENIGVITTVTPTPTSTVTIRPIKNIQIRVTLKKTNAIKEIDRRLESLIKLSDKIGGMKRITLTQINTLIAQIQIEISKLEELKVKINAETDATALQELKNSINQSYKIYALFIPKIEIMAHADKIITLSEAMAAKTTDEALLTKINDSKAKAQSALDLVIPLLPEQYPDYRITLKSARDLLRLSRTQLNDVFSVLKSED